MCIYVAVDSIVYAWWTICCRTGLHNTCSANVITSAFVVTALALRQAIAIYIVTWWQRKLLVSITPERRIRVSEEQQHYTARLRLTHCDFDKQICGGVLYATICNGEGLRQRQRLTSRAIDGTSVGTSVGLIQISDTRLPSQRPPGKFVDRRIMNQLVLLKLCVHLVTRESQLLGLFECLLCMHACIVLLLVY